MASQELVHINHWLVYCAINFWGLCNTTSYTTNCLIPFLVLSNDVTMDLGSIILYLVPDFLYFSLLVDGASK